MDANNAKMRLLKNSCETKLICWTMRLDKRGGERELKFTVSNRESDFLRELSRSTKIPEKVQRIAPTYERGGDRAYNSNTGKSAAPAIINIKQEPVGNIRQRTSSFKIEGDEDAESAGGAKFP